MKTFRTIFLLAVVLPLCTLAQLQPYHSSPVSTHDFSSPVRITKCAVGYVVYNNDTIKGYIELAKNDVQIEAPLDNKYSRFYTIKMKDKALTYMMMYTPEKRPVAMTRVRPNDKTLMRVVHEGKLNIYDDRLRNIYTPGDIDKNLILISHNGVVDDLSSFFTENTKRDLIGYVNDIYGLNLNPKAITWQELLVQVDMLD